MCLNDAWLFLFIQQHFKQLRVNERAESTT